jgi:rSAM/selenodomain-associated transferase 2
MVPMNCISIVIPVLDDAAALRALLDDLQELAMGCATITVVDGGSSDGSAELARARGVRVLHATRGRASQLAAGVAAADGRWVWLLHADTRVSAAAWHALQRTLTAGGSPWGRFDVRLDGSEVALRCVETLMNVRSRLSSICTGDQGIFVRRDLLDLVGGVPQLALMEDIELSKRLRRYAPPCCISTPLVTSARRWQNNGIVATIGLMWWLRLRYFLGAAPEALARSYYQRDEYQRDE